MFHIKNREGLVLAPTHEEIITFHARQHVRSYRDMPQIWYQIQTKFRNEPRPKSGVLRGRQFIMKDAYSLDTSLEGLDANYNKHYEAYKKIFSRCGLKFFVVGASSGAMGGTASQEFMVESDAGEDICAVTDTGYAANLEVAVSALPPVGRIDSDLAVEEFPTPNVKTIDDLIEHFGLSEDRLAKSVVYIVADKPIMILMRGNDQLNESKLETIFKTNNFRPAEAEELVSITGAHTGSMGPVGLSEDIKIYADLLLKDANGLVSGANKDGYHYKNIDLQRDCKIENYYDFRTVQPGEPSVTDGTPLRVVKAIELGHIFKLGTKYSRALGANFLDAEGKEHPINMGSYGIGVERVMACYLEQNYDDHGIIWNNALTPFHVHILGLGLNRSEEVKKVADEIYTQLSKAGFDVLFDDRSESPGVKFNDADLIGIPVQIIAGAKNIKNGNIEFKLRSSSDREIVPINSIVDKVKEYYKKI